MRTPLLTPLTRYEHRVYRSEQRARAFKLSVYAGACLLAGVSIGALAAQNLLAAAAVFAAGTLIGYGIHSLTRPMP